ALQPSSSTTAVPAIWSGNVTYVPHSLKTITAPAVCLCGAMPRSNVFAFPMAAGTAATAGSAKADPPATAAESRAASLKNSRRDAEDPLNIDIARYLRERQVLPECNWPISYLPCVASANMQRDKN